MIPPPLSISLSGYLPSYRWVANGFDRCAVSSFSSSEEKGDGDLHKLKFFKQNVGENYWHLPLVLSRLIYIYAQKRIFAKRTIILHPTRKLIPSRIATDEKTK